TSRRSAAPNSDRRRVAGGEHRRASWTRAVVTRDARGRSRERSEYALLPFGRFLRSRCLAGSRAAASRRVSRRAFGGALLSAERSRDPVPPPKPTLQSFSPPAGAPSQIDDIILPHHPSRRSVRASVERQPPIARFVR